MPQIVRRLAALEIGSMMCFSMCIMVGGFGGYLALLFIGFAAGIEVARWISGLNR